MDPNKRTAPSARLAFHRHPMHANCRGVVLSTAKAAEIRAHAGGPVRAACPANFAGGAAPGFPNFSATSITGFASAAAAAATPARGGCAVSTVHRRRAAQCAGSRWSGRPGCASWQQHGERNGHCGLGRGAAQADMHAALTGTHPRLRGRASARDAPVWAPATPPTPPIRHVSAAGLRQLKTGTPRCRSTLASSARKSTSQAAPNPYANRLYLAVPHPDGVHIRPHKTS